jgi:hypothetical protein
MVAPARSAWDPVATALLLFGGYLACDEELAAVARPVIMLVSAHGWAAQR